MPLIVAQSGTPCGSCWSGPGAVGSRRAGGARRRGRSRSGGRIGAGHDKTRIAPQRSQRCRLTPSKTACKKQAVLAFKLSNTEAHAPDFGCAELIDPSRASCHRPSVHRHHHRSRRRRSGRRRSRHHHHRRCDCRRSRRVRCAATSCPRWCASDPVDPGRCVAVDRHPRRPDGRRARAAGRRCSRHRHHPSVHDPEAHGHPGDAVPGRDAVLVRSGDRRRRPGRAARQPLGRRVHHHHRRHCHRAHRRGFRSHAASSRCARHDLRRPSRRGWAGCPIHPRWSGGPWPGARPFRRVLRQSLRLF